MAASPRSAVFAVAAVVFLSKFLGFAREMVIAGKFGTSFDYDLYLIALIIPSLAYGVLNFACFYLFVPFLTKQVGDSSRSEAEKWRTIFPAVNMFWAISVVATCAIIVSAPYVMRIWATGLSPDQFATVCFYSRVTAGLVALGVIEAFCRAYLNVRGIYSYPAAGYIVFNLFSIGSILLLHDKLGVGAIALGIMGGLVVQNLFLLLRVFRFIPVAGITAKIFTAESKGLLAAGALLIGIEAVNRSYFMIDRYFAPQFGEGVVSALNYASVLVQLPEAIVGFAIGAVVFPLFSSASVDNDPGRFYTLYRKTIIGAALVAAPLAMFFYVNADGLVDLIFRRGAFDAQSAAMTSALLRPLAPAVFALFIVSTSVRACYARDWAKVVLMFSLVLIGSKLVLSYLLPTWFGYAGLTAATTVSWIAFAGLLMHLVIRRAATKDSQPILPILLKIILAGLIGGVATIWLTKLLPEFNSIMNLLMSSVMIMATYLVVLILLGLKGQLLEALGGRFGRSQ